MHRVPLHPAQLLLQLELEQLPRIHEGGIKRLALHQLLHTISYYHKRLPLVPAGSAQPANCWPAAATAVAGLVAYSRRSSWCYRYALQAVHSVDVG